MGDIEEPLKECILFFLISIHNFRAAPPYLGECNGHLASVEGYFGIVIRRKI